MNKQLILYNKNYKSLLDQYCNTHHSIPRVSENPESFLRQSLYLINPNLTERHNAYPYFITITFPKSKEPLHLQWKIAIEHIERLKKQISNHYLIIAGIIAIEPHKNTTLKYKKGKNTKAGAPHFHMVLWLSHEFLNPSINQMRTDFHRSKLMVKINRLNTDLDVIKALLYTTKDGENQIIKNFCKKFTAWPNNINIWINHIDVIKAFENLSDMAQQRFFVTQECYSWVPTTRFHKNKAVLLAELYTKLFKQRGLAVKDQYVYERIENTLFSWRRLIPLSTWVANTFNQEAPVEYLAMLKQHANWIASQGKTHKTDVNYQLFPKLIIQLFLVEFSDLAYEFKSGKTLPFNEIAYEINSICHVNQRFNEIKPPYTTLALLSALINYGRDDLQQAQQYKLLPTEKLQGWQLTTLQKWDKAYQALFQALIVFGGLYHFDMQRKQNKALFLSGDPNTYKTTLLKVILSKLVGLDHVDILSRTSGRFNTANLRKDDDSPYVLIMDDLRWEHLGMPEPDLLNLLDGNYVKTEHKFEKPQHGPLKGNIAVTSNQSIHTENREYTDTKALESRMHMVKLYNLNHGLFQDENLLFQQITQEAIAFSILTNYIFLTKKCNKSPENVHLPASFFQKPQKLDAQQQNGYHLLNNILADV